ncbi:hypothetical protein MHBO_003743 [Bonamia ostreae]|uniref:Uncharacterized protein n=1 Tax=Bonamia ostreae TaxID=126728 RepID=A0ABV2ARD7_9EUKA
MGAVYLVGAFIYAIRFPEVYLPGRFDYFFNSHQLWHVAVFMGAFIHYFAVLKMYDSSVSQFLSMSLRIQNG